MVLTMVTQHKEARSREVRVEFDEDDVGGGVDRLQGCVATELTNLGRRLVRTVPFGETKRNDVSSK